MVLLRIVDNTNSFVFVLFDVYLNMKVWVLIYLDIVNYSPISWWVNDRAGI